MIFGEKYNVPATRAARMLLAGHNESNVVTQLKETVRPSPAISLSLTQSPFIILSLTLYVSLNITSSTLDLSCLHPKLLLALHNHSVVSPHT
jgi:hypothetical protein